MTLFHLQSAQPIILPDKCRWNQETGSTYAKDEEIRASTSVKWVKRVTTVLEPDTETDNMDQSYSQAVQLGNVEVETRDTDIQEWGYTTYRSYSDMITVLLQSIG